MPMSDMETGLILAAGGLVERQTARGTEIAVIRRERYGVEWALPKGKLKEKEAPWEAAVREVKEETGCNPDLAEFAGATQYQHGRRPKIVLFWRMRVAGDCHFQPSEEVKELKWTPAAEAIKRLTHTEEKKLVARVYAARAPAPRGSRSWTDSLWYALGSSSVLRFHRLESALFEYRVQLEWRLCRPREAGQDNLCWAGAAHELVRQAEQALERKNFDGGWQHLQAAQAFEIWSYSPHELKHKAAALRQEAQDKLGGWRQRSILQLLGDGQDPTIAPDQGSVYLAALIRDEHFHTLYHRIALRRSQLRFVWLALVAFVVTLPVLARFGITPREIGDWRTLLVIELFGSLGALFSVALTLTSRSVQARIPEQVVDSFVTWMRPAIGAAAAVVAYLLFRAGLAAGVLRGDMALAETGIAILIVSFAAGFSERLVVGALDKVAGPSGDKGEKR